MKRYMKTSALSPAKDLEGYLSLNEAAFSLYGSGLAECEIKTLDDHSYEVHMKRCFAYENVVRAGIEDRCECGIFARIQGWIDAQGLEHELTPPLGKCMMVLGKEYYYTIKLKFG